MPVERILILGGTREARLLAGQLYRARHHVVTSLAGVTLDPELPEGLIRRGGFGGAAGLIAYLRSYAVTLLIDATHPFAEQMPRHAHEAAQAADVPLIRLERPGWHAAREDRWIPSNSAAEAANLLPAGARAFVTIGRKEAGVFFARPDICGLARMIEPPGENAHAGWTILLARPPFTLSSELDLMQRHAITHLVTKNAGGEETAKLEAARQLAIPVVMIARPRKPEVPTFATVQDLIAAHGPMLLP